MMNRAEINLGFAAETAKAKVARGLELMSSPASRTFDVAERLTIDSRELWLFAHDTFLGICGPRGLLDERQTLAVNELKNMFCNGADRIRDFLVKDFNLSLEESRSLAKYAKVLDTRAALADALASGGPRACYDLIIDGARNAV